MISIFCSGINVINKGGIFTWKELQTTFKQHVIWEFKMNIKQWSESCQCSSKIHSYLRRRMKLTHLFSMHLTVFWRFQGVEKGCIGNKWVNRWKCWRVFTSGDVWCARLWIRKHSHTIMYSSVSWALSYLALFFSFQVF